MAGYAFAKLRFRGRDRLFRALLGGARAPGAGRDAAALPAAQAAWASSTPTAGVIIPGLASIFGIFLVRQYALSIPDDLLDAARIDGAGELRIFWSIVVPAIVPILATLAIWTFLGDWNDFMWPLIVLSDESHYTLPVALANLVGRARAGHRADDGGLGPDRASCDARVPVPPALLHPGRDGRERERMIRRFAPLLFLFAAHSEDVVIDTFDSTTGWKTTPSDGVSLDLVTDRA